MSRRQSSGRRSSLIELSFFDPRFYADGLASLTRPRSGNLLEMLGKDEEERVETVARMLREAPEADVTELTRIVQQAMTVVAQERAEGRPPPPTRPRPQSAEERRAERRRRTAS